MSAAKMNRSRAEVLRMFSDFMETFDEFVEDDGVFWTLPDGREIPSERIDDFRRYSECVEAFRSLRLADGESFIDMVNQNTTSTESNIDFLQGARMFIDKLEVRRAEPARLTRQAAADPSWELEQMNIGGESKDALTFAPFDPREDIANLRVLASDFRSCMEEEISVDEVREKLRGLPGHSELKDKISELFLAHENVVLPQRVACSFAVGELRREIRTILDRIEPVPIAEVDDSDSDPELSAAYGEIDSDTLAYMTTDEDEEDDRPPIARRLFPPEDPSSSDSELSNAPFDTRLRF